MLKLFCYCVLLLFSPPLMGCPHPADKSPDDVELIKPFIAQYQLNHKSDPFGKATRQLEYREDGSIKYSYHTQSKWFLFSDKRKEVSIVSIKDNKVLPSHYRFQRSGTGKNKNHEWIYQPSKNLATDVINNKELSVNFPENFEDKLSYQLQLQLMLRKNPQQKQFDLPVISTSGSIKNYHFEYAADEVLELPYGSVKTIKLKREVRAKKRITYVWFSPELDFLIVKFSQFKKGKEQFNAQLTSVEFGDISLDPVVLKSLPNCKGKIDPANEESQSTDGCYRPKKFQTR